jgi:hypothetical protein
MYIGFNVKYAFFLSDFNDSLIFLDRFSKNPQIPNLMKIRPVAVRFFHPYGQTGRHDEANGRFSQFSESA